MSIKTSVITHPPKMPMAVLREDYLKLCEMNQCAAILLNVFEHWTNSTLADEDEVWISRSHDELSTDMLGLFARRMIMTAVNFLLEKGFIERRHNPQRGFDRQYQYKLAIQKVQEAINKAYYSIGQKSTMQSAKKHNALGKKAQAIKETIEETIEETTTPPTAPEVVVVVSQEVSQIGEIVKAYEDNIGAITPMISDSLKDLLKDYSKGWIIDAIKEAVKSEKRTLRYVEGVLKNWKRDGRIVRTTAPSLPYNPNCDYTFEGSKCHHGVVQWTDKDGAICRADCPKCKALKEQVA